MTPKEFLITLEEELKYLPKNKRTNILNIYQDKINTEMDLGTPEDQIVQKFLNPKLIAEDIYEKEGINYLERRKRKLKSDDVFKMIVSSIFLILTVSASLVITGLIGYGIYQMIKLLTLLASVKDVILMSLLAVSIIGITILVYIYLIDIIILIINMLLDKIFKVFNKNLNINDFSIVDYLEEKLNKPKIIKKVFITFIVLFGLFVISNIILKTYLYRSYFQEQPTNINQTVNLNQYIDRETIKINIDEANVILKSGTTFGLQMTSEFHKDILVKEENGIVLIDTDEIENFDIFNFLKEPIPYIEITIPNDKNLDIEIYNGSLEIKDITLNNLLIDQELGNLIINNTVVDESTIDMYNGGVNIVSTTINQVMIKGSIGKLNIEKGHFVELQIKNESVDSNIKEVNANSIVVDTYRSNNVYNTIVCNNINFNILSGNVYIDNIKCVNLIEMISTSSANFTLNNAEATNTQVKTVTGSITYENVKADSIVETGASAILTKIEGNFNIKCLGNFLTLEEAICNNMIIETRQTETSIKFIKADNFEYIGMDSMSTLYFVFAKTIEVEDPAGNIHIDNYKEICINDDERTLYDKYYQKVENIVRSNSISYRDSDGVIY